MPTISSHECKVSFTQKPYWVFRFGRAVRVAKAYFFIIVNGGLPSPTSNRRCLGVWTLESTNQHFAVSRYAEHVHHSTFQLCESKIQKPNQIEEGLNQIILIKQKFNLLAIQNSENSCLCSLIFTGFPSLVFQELWLVFLL